MTWVADHLWQTALIAVWAAAVAWLLLLVVRTIVRSVRDRTPDAVDSLRARIVAERDDMASVPDDRPEYEDEPQTAYTGLPVADQALFHDTRTRNLDDAGWTPAAVPPVREFMPARVETADVRPVTADDYDPEQHVEQHVEGVVVQDSGWNGWLAGNDLPRRPDRVVRSITTPPPLRLETSVPALIGWDVEAEHGDPNEGHSLNNETGAFRWGPDGILVPVADLVAELRAERDQGHTS